MKDINPSANWIPSASSLACYSSRSLVSNIEKRVKANKKLKELPEKPPRNFITVNIKTSSTKRLSTITDVGKRPSLA